MNPAPSVVRQFRQPSGVVGHLAGWIMARRPSNIERNLWTLELLNLEAGDHLLEVGYGPGIAIEAAAKVITQGRITGIDHSPTMYRQARARNRRAVEDGRVRLLTGSVEELPLDAGPFDKICSMNVVQFWDSPEAVFCQLRLCLNEGGRLATTYMPRHRGARPRDAMRRADRIATQLSAAGFSHVAIHENPMKPMPVISVLATSKGQ